MTARIETTRRYRLTKSGGAQTAGSGQATPNDKRRSRFQRDPRGGLILGPRDINLLATLYQHRAMSRSQLQALFFTSLPRCNARLRQLFDRGFVARYYLPAAPFGAQAVYLPGKASATLLAARLEMEADDVRRNCRARTPLFLEHTLQIVEFYLTLRAATSAVPDVEIECWLPEALCRDEYDFRAAGGTWRRAVFKPDGFVRLAGASASDSRNLTSYFVEIDLGHTSSRQFFGKLQSYRRYLESGLFADVYGGNQFRTLVITTGARRLHNLCMLVEAEGSELFWLSTFERLRADPLGPIWQIPGRPEAVCLTQQTRDMKPMAALDYR